jgi:CDP-2,3-bis-(O-geranylgeranyl)-sn-glycerol synthase
MTGSLGFLSNLNLFICSLLEVLECYIISAESFIIPLLSTLLSAFWIMVPAYVPNPVAALCGGGTPIDFDKNYSDGRRLLGDGKTYRGLACGVLAGIAVGALQIWLASTYGWTIIPQEQTAASIVILAFGALLGDMVKSFVKRRLGKNRGEAWPIADQYDLVAGAFILMLIFDPSWIISNLTLPVFIVILILTPILHRAVNIIGYLCGVKKEPW